MKVDLILQANIKIKEGAKKLTFKRPDFFRQQCNQFSEYDDLEVIIRKKKSKRSLNMNAYWHGVCFPILTELMSDYNEVETKKYCTQEFITPVIKKDPITGKEKEIPRGTSDLDKSEGWNFGKKMIKLASQLGGLILDPCSAGYYCGRSECEICSKANEELDKNIPYPESVGEVKF